MVDSLTTFTVFYISIAIKNKYRAWIFALMTCVASYFPTTINADSELPLLGENASVNIEREIELGRGLYLKLKEHGYVIDDPLLSHYLSDIGHSLLSSLEYRSRDYHFYLVKDQSVNAFATPGGYIGVNVGLIAMTRSEDELASVLAHEIAHVELMHSMQMIEKAQDVNMASVISILAAILLSGSDPNAASAILYSGMAGSTQSMINFTRANEYEADRLGVELLKKSEYLPSAMVNFMLLLQSRESGGELSSIEYIRTHPVNSNRVAEIRSRLESDSSSNEKHRVVKRYQQFKDYLFYQYYPESEKFRDNSFYDALLKTRNGKFSEAESIYRSLIKGDPDSIWYSYALAENMEFQNRSQEAREIYQSMLLLYPDELAIGTRVVNILMKQGDIQSALEITLTLERKHEQNPQVYQLLVALYERNNNELMKALSEANYHWYSGNKKQAEKLYIFTG